MADYRAVNRANWDERAPAHAASPDYQTDRYAADPTFLSQVVRFDRPLLGDASGLRGVAADGPPVAAGGQLHAAGGPAGGVGPRPRAGTT